MCDKTTVLGNHCGAFIASPNARTNILEGNPIHFDTRPEMEQTVRDMKMEYAPDLAAAVAMARAEKGAQASVTLIPNGISVIVKA